MSSSSCLPSSKEISSQNSLHNSWWHILEKNTKTRGIFVPSAEFRDLRYQMNRHESATCWLVCWFVRLTLRIPKKTTGGFRNPETNQAKTILLKNMTQKKKTCLTIHFQVRTVSFRVPGYDSKKNSSLEKPVHLSKMWLLTPLWISLKNFVASLPAQAKMVVGPPPEASIFLFL